MEMLWSWALGVELRIENLELRITLGWGFEGLIEN